ncbi:hypothetical protein NDU88_007417 [Pleurodeles waltl]|uniref:TPA-induced transmembrane protein n=1 Tax=Pleurodeles waltl TaxID=8319 RepID=A0AAV7NUW8_PLEWA|nr:hypothetical protein NDU88_007417 [Pleurodeles waltl]
MGSTGSENIELSQQSRGNSETNCDVIDSMLPGDEETEPLRQNELLSANNEQPHYIPSEKCPNGRQDIRSLCSKPVYRKCTLWMAIASGFLILVFVTVISLIMYSTIYSDDDGYESLLNGSSQYYTGTLKISDQCTNSEALSEQLTERIADVYKTSPALGHYFTSAKVVSLSEDNNIATYHLQFTVPPEASNFLKYTMSEEFVGGVLRQDVYDQEHTDCTPVLLDPSSITLSFLRRE